MDFGTAIIAMRAGRAVRREGWNGKGMFVVHMDGMVLAPFSQQEAMRRVNDRTARWIGPDMPLTVGPYFAMFTAQQVWQPGWLASQADMLAQDWEIVPGLPLDLPEAT